MMRHLLTVSLTFSLASCCLCEKKDVAIEGMKAPPQGRTTTFETHPDYPGQFLACRAAASTETVHTKLRKITAGIEKANDEGKTILLYFHGGLSSQSYMKKTLGPRLMKTLFTASAYKDAVHPVLVNYDAGPLEIFKKIYKNQPKKAGDPDYKDYEAVAKAMTPQLHTTADALVNELKGASATFTNSNSLTQLFNQNPNTFNPEQLKQWQNLLTRSAAVLLYTTKKNAASFVPVPESEMNVIRDDAREIVQANTIPGDYRHILDTGLVDTPFQRIINTLPDNSKTLSPQSTGLNLAYRLNETSLRALRVIARLALNTDHGDGVFTTLQEELWQAIEFPFIKNPILPRSLGDYANKHWNLVKEHALECFADGSAGDYLVKYLLEHNIPFSTLSHSAGSIPVAILIDKVASSPQAESYKKAVMVAPAVSQKVFAEAVLKHQNMAEKVYIYPLNERYERSDKVFNKLLYNGSLLYAVSSLAEDQITLDQFLLIEQHLKDSFPYNSDWYPSITCEKPGPVRAFFDNRPTQLRYYPGGITDTSTCPSRHTDAATHENTKFPDISRDLASDYMKLLTSKEGCPLSQ